MSDYFADFQRILDEDIAAGAGGGAALMAAETASHAVSVVVGDDANGKPAAPLQRVGLIGRSYEQRKVNPKASPIRRGFFRPMPRQAVPASWGMSEFTADFQRILDEELANYSARALAELAAAIQKQGLVFTEELLQSLRSEVVAASARHMASMSIAFAEYGRIRDMKGTVRFPK